MKIKEETLIKVFAFKVLSLGLVALFIMNLAHKPMSVSIEDKRELSSKHLELILEEYPQSDSKKHLDDIVKSHQ